MKCSTRIRLSKHWFPWTNRVLFSSLTRAYSETIETNESNTNEMRQKHVQAKNDLLSPDAIPFSPLVFFIAFYVQNILSTANGLNVLTSLRPDILRFTIAIYVLYNWSSVRRKFSCLIKPIIHSDVEHLIFTRVSSIYLCCYCQRAP